MNTKKQGTRSSPKAKTIAAMKATRRGALVTAGPPAKLLASLNSKKPSRLTHELLETAKDMHASGIMDDAAYTKITMRHLKS